MMTTLFSQREIFFFFKCSQNYPFLLGWPFLLLYAYDVRYAHVLRAYNVDYAHHVSYMWLLCTYDEGYVHGCIYPCSVK